MYHVDDFVLMKEGKGAVIVQIAKICSNGHPIQISKGIRGYYQPEPLNGRQIKPFPFEIGREYRHYTGTFAFVDDIHFMGGAILTAKLSGFFNHQYGRDAFTNLDFSEFTP